MDEPQPSWIDARARCHPGVVFDELRDVVERDVKAFNELPDDLRLRRTAGFWAPTNETRRAFGVSVQVDQCDVREVSFSVTYGSYIRIGFNQGRGFRVRAEWDWTMARRVLLVEPEQPHEDDQSEALSLTAMWQVSEWALGTPCFGP